jgi:hypothetical protein
MAITSSFLHTYIQAYSAHTNIITSLVCKQTGLEKRVCRGHPLVSLMCIVLFLQWISSFVPTPPNKKCKNKGELGTILTLGPN